MPRSLIAIRVNVWVSRGKWDTYCNFRHWRLSRIWQGLPLMCFLMIGVSWYSNRLRYSMIYITPSNWSAWWRWQVLISLWWSLFRCTWCIICPCLWVPVSRFIFSVETGWSLWGQWAVKFVCQISLDVVRRCIQFLEIFFVPMCISRPNWEKWLERRVITFSMLVLYSKTNAPSST